jgi:hypothetical protein
MTAVVLVTTRCAFRIDHLGSLFFRESLYTMLKWPIDDVAYLPVNTTWCMEICVADDKW